MIPFRHYGGAVLIAPHTEDEYFSDYRKAYPQEQFDVVDYDELLRYFSYGYSLEEVVNFLSSFGYEEGEAKDLPPYLCRMTKDKYKSPELEKLLPIKEKLVSQGIFQKQGDSAAFFCNKTLIIRGYYSGLSISEALQDLPNISLNWDLGRPQLNAKEAPRLECSSVKGALQKAASRVTELVGNGVKKEDIYFRSDIPCAQLPGVKSLEGPFAPNGSHVIYLEASNPIVIPKDKFPPLALAELHLVTSQTAKKRQEADQHCFLCHPSLDTRLYVFPRD